MGPDSSVSIATRYGIDDPGIESRWGEIFCTRPDRPRGPPSLRHNGYRLFPGGKAAEAWSLAPSPSSAEVKERVEPYLHSPSGSSWPVIGWPLPLPYILQVVSDRHAVSSCNCDRELTTTSQQTFKSGANWTLNVTTLRTTDVPQRRRQVVRHCAVTVNFRSRPQECTARHKTTNRRNI